MANHSPGALKAIAVFKFFKGLLLITAGVAALKLLGKNPPEVVEHLSARFNLDAYPRLFETLLSKSFQLDAKKLEAFGVGSFAYAALFLVEGVGLWLQKRWAEYVTIISTTGFIPFELYEIAEKPNVTRIVVLAINVAIVIYLIVRVVHERREGRPKLKPAAA